jgi:D-arabinose 1-dehydrogenase-like Zn-dependent alcohol dehydrogenase
VVEQIGSEVKGVKVGDRRLVYPWIGCRTCPTCARGLEHLCPKPRNLGVNVDGGFATHVILDGCRAIDADGSLARAHADMAAAGVAMADLSAF